jgi:hypothetical protein
MNSKWGAHDGVVMNRMVDELNKSTKTIFCHLAYFNKPRTLLKHRFHLFLTEVTTTTRFLNSLHYTDQVVGDFIDKCSRQSLVE